MKASGIYEIVNAANGKRYVGSARSFKVRWAKHLGDLKLGRHHSAYLQRSWAKYGHASFSFNVIEKCQPSDLIVREQFWIDKTCPEYNVSPTAGNCLGVKHSAETKLKHRLSMTGRKFPEAAAKRTGQKRTLEQRARLSEIQKIAFAALSTEQKEQRRLKLAAVNPMRGKKQSKELIAKRAQAMIGHVVSEETRKKLSIANAGKKPSASAIAALRARKGKPPSEKMLKAARDNAHKRRGIPRPPHVVEALRKANANWSTERREKIAAYRRGTKLSAETIAKRTATRRANGGYAVSTATRAKTPAFQGVQYELRL